MKNKIFNHAIGFSFGIILYDFFWNTIINHTEGYTWLGATFKTVFTLLFFAFIYGRKFVEKNKDTEAPKEIEKLPIGDYFRAEKEMNFFKK